MVVIGGGIAGVGAAWNLAESGFKVTVFEARQQCSGNARTFDWHGYEDGAFENDTVKSCVSVTAWPPIFYKNYTALLDRYARHILRSVRHAKDTNTHITTHDSTTQNWR